MLGWLLSCGNKAEIEIFVRGHGANPIFSPQEPLGFGVGVAKADIVNMSEPVSEEAAHAILNGDIVHLLFQAGEGSRFKQGPFYNINPMVAADVFKDEVDTSAEIKKIEAAVKSLPANIAQFILEEAFGPKQAVLIRAALRRIIKNEIEAGRLTVDKAETRYEEALKAQKIIFLIS